MNRLPLLALSLLTATFAQAADWGFIGGPNGNRISTEKISQKWPEAGPKQLWKVPSDSGFSSFVVGDGGVFTLEMREVDGAKQEVCVARNADTGKELWVKSLGIAKYDGGGDSGTAENKGGDGPRSTPTYDHGKVFVTSAKLVVSAFDAKTGNLLWQHDVVKEFAGRNIQWQNAASPLVEGKLVLVAGGGAGQSLLAFDKDDGAVAWKAFDETMTQATPTPATILGQPQVIFFLKSGLLAIEPKTGAELWRYSFPFRVSTAASPVVAGDIVYCSAGYGIGAGACKVTKSGGKFSATEVYRFPGNKPLANHWSTPVLKDGFLYGLFQFKEYGNGPLKCVDVKTGAVKW
ncbi:MAG TPA: PQQ-binding-like beta-propeller repeat protein, partial [Candidatus Limnocylindria bacterium]|nr:PQQ-binding-like beta-propeller repeat protein [Candidatus Limnocylindria bacterium]